MTEANQPPRRLRFGVFEADIGTGELTKLGKRVRLQEQPFQLLAILLDKPGELVTREELRDRLWPQTIIDFDHGLNKAISKIREALGDSAENPRFIETIARRGYRFLADVSAVDDEEAESVNAEHSIARGVAAEESLRRRLAGVFGRWHDRRADQLPWANKKFARNLSHFGDDL